MRKSDFIQDNVYVVEKHRGETLAVFLDRFRIEYDISESEKITYAGRLDPMAEGLVILLVGQARFQKEKYIALSKTYETTFVFGFTTDTLDPLGLITSESKPPSVETIKAAFAALPETLRLAYPRYSSKPIQGKPSFMYAREGIQVEAPLQTMHILQRKLLESTMVSIETLADDAIEIVKRVQGDFRQKESIASWQQFVQAHPGAQYQAVTFQFTVTSGTYIRALAKWFGEKTAGVAYAHHIRRTALN